MLPVDLGWFGSGFVVGWLAGLASVVLAMVLGGMLAGGE